MMSLPRRVIGKIVSFREGEARTAVLMFAYSFLAMTAYNILKPVTRSQYINKLGADNLPYVQLAAGLIIGLLMQLYSLGVAKLPRRWVIPVTVAGEAGLLLAFWVLFHTGATWVSVAFYVMGLILGVLLISQFWTLANDIYDPRQAKRLFGFIGGGASLGGVVGNGLTAFLVDEIGTNNLLLVSAAILLLCVGLVTVIVRHREITADLVVTERGVGGAEAIRLLGTSRHLQVIALVIGLAAIGAAIIEQQLNMATAAVKGADPDDITAFLAWVGIYVSLIGLVVQVGFTSRIHRSMGLAFALLVLPMSLGGTAIVILLNGALWAPAAARVLDSSLRYTVDKTTREVLFLPFSVDIKYRAKAFIDVTMDRFAKAIGALLCLVLIKPWGLNLSWPQLSYASLAITGLWIVAAMRARREYLLAFRRSVGGRELSPAVVRLDAADGATIEALVEELANPDEAAVLYAIDMLEALDKPGLVTPLLLHHESPRVRARALVALEAAPPNVGARWLPFVERMLGDEDAGVRAGAMRALAALRKDDAPRLIRQWLDHPDARIAITAAAALSDGAEADARAAEETFKRVIADTRGPATGARREAAAALGRVTGARFRSLLVPLLNDRDPEVVRQALRSVEAGGQRDPLFIPAIICLLGRRAVKREARGLLASYGEAAADALAYVLRDADEHLWVRRHIPATLARMPSQPTLEALLAVIDDPDGFLRFKAVEAIEHIRRNHPGLVIATASIEPRVIKETARYYDCLTLRHNVVSGSPRGQASLLVRALEDKLDRVLDRIYRLLGLIYPWTDIDDARYAVEHGDARTRASAVEYLDTLLHGQIRARVMPIVDVMPMADKVRHANSVLKSRPRDLEDTLAQLVHDDDPIVCAAAIYFIENEGLWSLAGDLEFVLEHRPVSDWCVFEAASWALAAYRAGSAGKSRWLEPLPAVNLVDRMRPIPLFDFVSVDELFRIAALGRQVRHEKGHRLYADGSPADDVHFLLEGSGTVQTGSATETIAAPAAIGFEEALADRTVSRATDIADRSVCLSLTREDLLTVLSDNTAVAQGLFRMLLNMKPVRPGSERTAQITSPVSGNGPRAAVAQRGSPLRPIDKVSALRAHPLLARATVEELLELAAITREVPLVAGAVLFTDRERPGIFHVLQGELRLDAAGADPVVVGPGAAVGVAETLAGTTLGRTATVSAAGRALQLGHVELFAVLADHIDLLQGLFSGVLGTAGRGHAPVLGPEDVVSETVEVS